MRLVLAFVFSFLSSVVNANPASLATVNAVRAGVEHAPLSYSDTLERVAQAHANDMAVNTFFSHTGSDGLQIADRARRGGYNFCFVAENIAKGQPTVDAALDAWRESPGHLRNMVDPRATELGLAAAPGAIWVMVLGRPGC